MPANPQQVAVRSLCPEAEFRASLDDGEFWEHVLNGVRPGEDPEIEADPFEEDPGPLGDYGGPCDICGEVGACGYDAEGRPLIHPTFAEEEA